MPYARTCRATGRTATGPPPTVEAGLLGRYGSEMCSISPTVR